MNRLAAITYLTVILLFASLVGDVVSDLGTVPAASKDTWEVWDQLASTSLIVWALSFFFGEGKGK